MNYQQILYENEEKYEKINDIMFGKVIEAFQKESALDIDSMIHESGTLPTDKQQAFWNLYNYLINHARDEIRIIFELLEQFEFNFKMNLCSCIRLLSSYTTDTIPDYIYDILLRVPMIDELECKSEKITVYR